MVEQGQVNTSVSDLVLLPRKHVTMDSVMTITQYSELRDDRHATHVLDNVSDMRQNHALFDVTLTAGAFQVPCHRIILAGASNYFRALFTCEMRERRQAEVPIIGVRPNILSLVIDFVYTGRAVGITPLNVQALAEAASFLQVLRLLNVCEQFMVETLTTRNAISSKSFAERFALDRLLKRAQFVLCDSFTLVASEAEFYALDEDALQRYLADDDLSVENENEVYSAVRRWLLHDFTNRMSSAGRVLSHVRFAFCTRDFFESSVRDDVLMSNPDGVAFIHEYDVFYLRPDKRSEIGGRRGVARDGMKDVLVLGGMTADGPSYDVWCYKPGSANENAQYEQSSRVATLPKNYSFFDACVCRKRLYMFGGKMATSSEPLADTWVFNSETRTWRQVSDMTRARMMHSSVECDGSIYVASGHGVSEVPAEDEDVELVEDGRETRTVGVVLRSTERYDPDADEWLPLPDMPVAVRRAAMAALDGRVYVIGGNTDLLASDSTDFVQAYDTTCGQWSRLSGLPNPVFGPTAIVTGDRQLYLHDGRGGRMMTYDARNDAWRPTGDACADDHFEGCGVWWRGRILMMGGKSKGITGRSQTADAYDAKAGTWQTVETTMHSPLSSFVIALLNIS